MFKEDIKIKILDEEHFNKVKEILVKEGYCLQSSDFNHVRDFLYAYLDSSVTYSMVNSHTNFYEHKSKEYILWGSNKLVPKVGVTLSKSVESNKILTPCEQLGYKVGDKFIVIENCSTFNKGTIIELSMDDGTTGPLFKGNTTGGYPCCDGEEGAYASLRQVKPIKDSDTNQEEDKMTERNKEPKNKPKTQSQLVFTYTNGKKYVVRGLQRVKVSLNGSKFQVDYTHTTYDGVKDQTSNVSVYVTNELVKVEKINIDNSVEVVLDLSSNSAKAVEGSKKPRGNARSKEEYEAMLEAKKAHHERNKAIVEAKARELATKMLKEGKI